MTFNLFGFPTTINGSFLLTVGFLGFLSFQEQLDRILLFVVIAVVAVVVHELGHAFAAKSQGTAAGPIISLESMAGFTRYRLREEPGRLASIFISFAGPLAGIVLGVIIVLLARNGVIDTDGNPLVDDAVRIGLFTTFGWSAFNLLPIVPLDGGHIMTDLIPGDQAVRSKRAAYISIAVAVVVGGFLYVQFDALFAAAILGMMAWQNIQSISRRR